MKLQYVASATLVIEHNGFKVLCDPWLTDGIYGGAWYHNPPLTVAPEDFSDIDALYISHIHLDHADWDTLERFPRVPVYVGSYAEAFMASKLRAMGFPVHELRHDLPHQLAEDFWIHVIPADDCNPEICGKWLGCDISKVKEGASYQLDTLAVFHGGGKTIINCNDVPYELGRKAIQRARYAYGRPDLLCVGYSGAGPWPQCFSFLSPEQMQAAAKAKEAQFIQQAKCFIADLSPEAFLPFAGQYTLGASLEPLNDVRGVPELEDLPQHFNDPRMVLLNRNAWFDCDTGTASEPFTPVSREQRLAYREVLAQHVLDHELDPYPTSDELADALGTAQRKLWDRCERRGFTSEWAVNVAANGAPHLVTRVTFQRDPTPTKSMGISIDARLLLRILKREVSLNNMEIGSQIRFDWRRPNEHDRGVQHHLSYWHI